MTAVQKTNGPLINPGLCRCCSSIKKCRLMTAEYEWMGQKEVYSDMILECFGLLLSNVDNEQDSCVCATCVVRLRDACSFRRQMLQCEDAFLKRLHDGKPDVKVIEVKIEMKDEPRDVANEHEITLTSYDEDDDNDPMGQPRAYTMQPSLSDEISTSEKSNVDVKCVKAVVKKKVDSNAERIMKLSLLRKMKIMEMKLKRALHKPVVSSTKKTPTKSEKVSKKKTKKPKLTKINKSKDFMSAQNLITLVESSYVYPFKNRRNSLYCFYCKEIFGIPDELRQHAMMHDPKLFENKIRHNEFTRIDVYRIDCRLCPERIDNLNDLKTHLVSVHNKKFHPNVPDHYVQFRLTFKDHACVMCSKSFSSFFFLYNHTIQHISTFTCDVCGKCFLQEAMLSFHLKLHKKDSLNCEYCGKAFNKKRNKELHINNIHKKTFVIPCPKCDEKFRSYAVKNRHLIERHGEPIKDFPCNICDKVYHRRKGLTEHIRRYHSTVIKHQCE